MTTALEHILSRKTLTDKRFISDYKELKRLVDTAKKSGHKIVLTQGVFDLIHGGHALYLEKCRALGDILIVGIDSDELTRKRKGPGRPIVPQDERLKMMMHLRHVDIVTLRHAKDQIGRLIRLIRPDVLVVSQSTKDFTQAMKDEYKDVCGEIVNLPPQSTTSTTARIRMLTIEGANQLAMEIKQLADDFIQKIKAQ